MIRGTLFAISFLAMSSSGCFVKNGGFFEEKFPFSTTGAQ